MHHRLCSWQSHHYSIIKSSFLSHPFHDKHSFSLHTVEADHLLEKINQLTTDGMKRGREVHAAPRCDQLACLKPIWHSSIMGLPIGRRHRVKSPCHLLLTCKQFTYCNSIPDVEDTQISLFYYCFFTLRHG